MSSKQKGAMTKEEFLAAFQQFAADPDIKTALSTALGVRQPRET